MITIPFSSLLWQTGVFRTFSNPDPNGTRHMVILNISLNGLIYKNHVLPINQWDPLSIISCIYSIGFHFFLLCSLFMQALSQIRQEEFECLINQLQYVKVTVHGKTESLFAINTSSRVLSAQPMLFNWARTSDFFSIGIIQFRGQGCTAPTRGCVTCGQMLWLIVHCGIWLGYSPSKVQLDII